MDFNENNFEETGKNQNYKKYVIIPIITVVVIVIAYMVVAKSCIFSHRWVEATCETPRTCIKCHETDGDALGHKWQEATCTMAKTCSVCKKIDGEPLGHTMSEWVTDKEPTCTEAGSKHSKCSVCGEEETESIPAAGHNLIDGEIIQYASLYSQGEKTQKCTKCGAGVSVAYDLTEAEKANINMVMNNTMDGYPDKTIGTAFSSFFSDPTWYAHGNYVLFSGGCTWNGADTTASIGFEVNGNRFQLGAFNIGGTTYDNVIILAQFMNTVYGYS